VIWLQETTFTNDTHTHLTLHTALPAEEKHFMCFAILLHVLLFSLRKKNKDNFYSSVLPPNLIQTS